MFRIVLECEGVPTSEGAEAANDIAIEFREHRKWYSKAVCTWTGSTLLLEVESDADGDGLGALDEFSDVLSAYVTSFEGDILIRSVTDL